MGIDHRRRLERLEAATGEANEPLSIEYQIVERIDGELVKGELYRMSPDGKQLVIIATGVPRGPVMPGGEKLPTMRRPRAPAGAT